ncbi:Branched-chain amino acid transport system / permease component [Acididesulfobacillus acetoxydans]|uniref:Branched-chain amino acid transport system / permease component n=1 Tax=Acididesulfobacillus acetoxydans TaxID=1561005 RepID=A0A8S0W7D1_9FIRM|nr:branched-chain amino acid ABC transporter permease [Acididesulfobacillus acetoxydans]CAA7600609.1 Branched-chain amino acid transport system / permease component [Acididesulfobacillus acetoxydans]CEJ09390.1 High-affinity branched-chain amino acid transport system permease protein BraE [Acididesulfobacillus acetoxydans]
MSKKRLTQYVLLAVLLVLVPQFVRSDYALHLMIMVAIYGILVLGLEIILGQTGLFSLGHAAFFGMGSYTSALLVMRLGMPIWLGIVLAVLASGILGFLLGFPTLRLRGDYLAIATLGFGEIFGLILVNWDSLTHGPMGIPGITRPEIFGVVFDKRMYLYLIVLLFILALAAAFRISNSFLGRTFRAIRDDEDAAEFLGIHISKYKILAFIIGGMFAGLAGGFYAHYVTFISPDSFTYEDSETLLAMVFLGGAGTVIGPVVGAVVLVLLPELLSFMVQWRMLVVGVIMVLVMIFRPQGLMGGGMKFLKIKKKEVARIGEKE